MPDPNNRQTPNSNKQRKPFFVFSLVLFLFSTLMGTGPGVWLVSGQNTVRLFAGVPILYAWVVLWFLIMVVSILILAWSGTLGRDDSPAAAEPKPEEKEEKR